VVVEVGRLAVPADPVVELDCGRRGVHREQGGRAARAGEGADLVVELIRSL
jgi:hypothetical protein